jgi:hypothetical protein
MREQLITHIAYAKYPVSTCISRTDTHTKTKENLMSDNNTQDSRARSGLADFDRIYLEKLRLATDILLRVGEDPDGLPNSLESELFLFRDRCEHALLIKPDAA